MSKESVMKTQDLGAWPHYTYPASGSPNVVFIVLDDVGFAHLGCYGSDIATPNMDRLAASGLRYNNFHTTALCSPTRASLLTGRNHHSVGMGMLAGAANGHPGHVGEISKSTGTVAEILRTEGYSTIALGKWHLTPLENISVGGPCDQWPLGRGFEQFYGFLGPETDQFFPDLSVGNDFIEPPDRPDYHLSEDLVDQAIERITNLKAADPERPHFTYLAFGAAHAPLQAPRAYIDKYAGSFDEGWDTVRDRVYHRQLEMGIIPGGTRLVDRNPGVPAWDSLTDTEKRVFARQQEVFAGFLDHTDAQIGRLVDHLEAIGEMDNTIIFLLSDNGASQEGGDVGRSELLWVTNTPVTVDDLVEHLDDLGGPDHHAHYPIGWAQVGNTPLKRYKQNTHGGGIRGPLIVTWPSKILDPGSIREQYLHVSDIVPTVLEALGVEPPDRIAGVDQKPLEGKSFLASLTVADAPQTKDRQYFEMLGHRGIWHEGWKAVTYHERGTRFEDDVWELYDTRTDFSESNDLASTEPAKLKELVGIWWDEAEKYQVQLDDLFHKRRLQGLYRRRLHYPKVARFHRGAKVPQFLAPAAPGMPQRVSASISRDTKGDEGVLACIGGRFGGFSLFVQDNRLHFEYGFYLQPSYHVQSAEELTVGRLECGFTVTGDGADLSIQLTVDGEAAAPALPITFIPFTPYGIEPFEVGRDGLTPVSKRYSSPFEFTGQLDHVEVQVPEDWPEGYIQDLTVEAVMRQD